MKDIKIKEKQSKFIKTLDKGSVLTNKLKNNIIEIKDKADYMDDDTVNEYSYDKLKDGANTIKPNQVINGTKKVSSKMKERYIKNQEKKLLKKNPVKIKNNIDKTVKATEKSAKATKIAAKRGKELAIKSAKATAKGIKAITKAVINGVKAILAALKSLIGLIAAGGTVAAVVIIVICLIGLLCASIFGIFFSSERADKKSYLMSDCITELNTEMDNRIKTIENMNPHDEIVFESNKASWKDMLSIFSVRISKGENDADVMLINNEKKKILKEVFWDMNSISSQVITEEYESDSIGTLKKFDFNTNNNYQRPNIYQGQEQTKEQKRVLHIYINSKSVEEMKTKYGFSDAQKEQFIELTSEKYDYLWSNVIYGISGSSGEITEWKQKGKEWSNIEIGHSGSTIGQIGCLVTSISIQIKKSGVPTNNIVPFNPGTFVISLNNNYGFDSSGNLSYSAVNRAVPSFKYVDRVNLRGKSKSEKLYEIKKYYEDGYYLVAEVKGATENSQHWVAIDNVTNNKILMLDPGSNATDMWEQYDWNKTTQFVYFKAMK